MHDVMGKDTPMAKDRQISCLRLRTVFWNDQTVLMIACIFMRVSFPFSWHL